MKKIELSIIIVNYKVEKELLNCLESIRKHIKHISYEVIIVENDSSSNIKQQLNKYAPITYIKSETNVGFGAGNNIGAKYAKGTYLFFLNPDTQIENGNIQALLNGLNQNGAGIIAPLLLDIHKKPYVKQGTRKLTLPAAIFSLSFIYLYFPKNPISGKFWLKNWNKQKKMFVDVVPGTAFFITKKLFDTVEGFDENFFLYFEENDLCNRVKKLGYTICIDPQLKVVHSWGKSTDQNLNIAQVFQASRRYYFKKYYGLIGILVDSAFLNKSHMRRILFAIGAILTLILALAIRGVFLDKAFLFDGEKGDNLLAIKDALITRTIPLVGPPTSRPWLSFSSLYYLLFAPFLAFYKFNPYAYAYLGIFVGVLTVFSSLLFLRPLIGKRASFILGLLISVSPLFIAFSISARFFAIIPILTPPFLLLFYEYVKGKRKHVFTLGLLFGLLMSFHYTPLMLIPFMMFVILISRKRVYVKDFGKFLIGTVVSLFPLLLYDMFNGFAMSQNLLFWVPYRTFGGIINVGKGSKLSEDSLSIIQFFQLSLSSQFEVAGILLILALLFYIVLKILNKTSNFKLLFFSVWTLSGLAAIIIHRNAPLHYFVPILAGPLVLLACMLSDAWKFKWGKVFFVILICGMLFGSIRMYQNLPERNELIDEQAKVAKAIIRSSGTSVFAIKRVGYNDQFDMNYAQNYYYLLWYYGKAAVQQAQQTFVIYEGEKIPKTYNKKNVIYQNSSILVVRK